MKIRKIVLLIASLAALSPVVSSASPEKSALNACAKAFASSLAATGAQAPTFKLAYGASEPTGSMMEFYNREFTFELHARDSKTGAQVAHASCSTDIRGNVVTLSALPADAVSPALAARLW
jgi:hypothetical protein